MKRYILIVLLIFAACKSSVKEKDIQKINGYWEIQKAETNDGKSIDYKVNETVDYFELKKMSGFRQKVMPQFDGTFQTNALQEKINIVENKGDFYIEYETPYGKWSEKIETIKDSILILKDTSNTQYHYKRYVPFSLK